MKAIVLGGFLGSGKTSVLIPMAHYLVKHSKNTKQKINVAIIENEIGEIGIDDQFIRNNGYNVKNLFGGCACCTLAGKLIDSIHSIGKDLNPEWLIIEATGVAYPNEIKKDIDELVGIGAIIISIVDANRWARIVVALEKIVIGQLENANAVFINKIDLVDDTVLNEVVKSIRCYNTSAMIYPVSAQNGIDDDIFRNILL
ncbi:MAG: GTP-binding protein [Desulfobacteraceae bacterium]|jgi:G3E family GTPase